MKKTPEKRIDRIEALVEKNAKLIGDLSSRVDGNISSIEALITRVDKNTESINALNQTVEDLAISVKRGFDGVYEKFDQVDARLDGMVTIAVFNERMDRVEFRFNEHDRRLDNLEDKVGLISRKIGLSRK
jgi:uncharacterized protein YoxC